MIRAYMIRGTTAALALLAIGQAHSQNLVGPIAKVRPLASWPMVGGDAARTNQSFATGPVQGQLVWKIRTAGRIPNLAVDAWGRVILGIYFIDESWSGESAFGILESSGEWVVRRLVTPYPWGAGQGVNSGPALDRVGNIYFNSGNGEFLKLNAKGVVTQTWQMSSASTNDMPPAVLPDGTAFIYQPAAGLKKMSPGGSVVWSSGASGGTRPAIAPNGDIAIGGVYTLEPHGSLDLTYVNANGSVRWSKSSTHGNQIVPTFGPDGTLYYGRTAFNPDGTVKWITTAPGPNRHSTVTLGRNNDIFYYLGSTLSSVNTSNGSIRWTATLPSGISINHGVILDARNMLHGTTADGYVFKVNATNGALVYMNQIATQLGSPALGTDKSLYAPGRDAELFINYVYKIQ